MNIVIFTKKQFHNTNGFIFGFDLPKVENANPTTDTKLEYVILTGNELLKYAIDLKLAPMLSEEIEKTKQQHKYLKYKTKYLELVKKMQSDTNI